MPVTLDQIEAAAERIAASVSNTPFEHSKTLSSILGAEIWLKFENLQFTSSFKERGALNKLSQLSAEEKQHGVIAMSAGNLAQYLGIPATIVMPRSTPNVKVEDTENFGARVILEGASLEDSFTYAKTLADEEKLCFVHPYNDEQIIAG